MNLILRTFWTVTTLVRVIMMGLLGLSLSSCAAQNHDWLQNWDAAAYDPELLRRLSQ